jgi:hypothetical protein
MKDLHDYGSTWAASSLCIHIVSEVFLSGVHWTQKQMDESRTFVEILS